jgi:hypothetical protein
MGKRSRLKNLGEKYKQQIEDIKKGLMTVGTRYDEHILDKYPKVEEDSEGTMYWATLKICRMEFKELTPQQGYVKTMEKFKRVRMDKFINCYIDDKYVVVELP